MTYRDQILKRLRSHWKDGNPNYFNGQRIEDWGHDNIVDDKGKHPKHATINRTLRNLEEDGLIEKTYEGKAQSVAYRYVPTEHEILSTNMQKIYG